jgi:hypothetical protein
MAAVSESFLPTLNIPSTSREVSAVSWGAVFAGAVGAAVFSMIMILLGTGVGLTVVSPWGGDGISAASAGFTTILWVTFVQIMASVLGGYLAGRLRSRWLTVHSHEVYFRDTAHGFLAWSVATLLMATLLSSAIGTALSTGVKAGAAVAGPAVNSAGAAANGAMAQGTSAEPEGEGYFVDSLFRPAPSSAAGGSSGAPSLAAASPNPDAEVARIFANALKNGSLPAADSEYLGQLVASRTGLPQAEAQMRVNDRFMQLQQTIEQGKTKAKEVADVARKASAYMALWLVVSLLVGAFVASWAATYGGRLRDSSALEQSRA